MIVNIMVLHRCIAMGRFQLELIYLYFPPFSTSTPTRPVDNVVITTKGLQDKNDGKTVENKGKLILQ